MTTSVDTIEAVFNNCECKLNSIICHLEETFSTYETLQRSLAEDSSLVMSPLTLVDKMTAINQQLIRIKEEYESMKKMKEELHIKYDKDVSDLECKTLSTLEYLVDKKKPTAK